MQHLAAAIAVWQYCDASARYVFGDAIGNPLADCILRRATPSGMTRTELSTALSHNRQAVSIDRALTLLQQLALAYVKSEPTAGRTAERWFATSPQ